MGMTGTWGHSGTRCRIKQGWEGAGREGDAISYFDHNRLGQEWTVVIWDDEDDPDCFKSAGLEIKRGLAKRSLSRVLAFANDTGPLP